jgi:hypothetical protein
MRIHGYMGYPSTSYYHDNYVNNRNTGGDSQPWIYDEDGRITNDRTRQYSFDAAGNQTYNSQNSIYRSFDGDGAVLKKIESGGITYYLRSSVVGEVINELNQYGQKQRGYVYREGEVLAKQEGGQVLWNHDEPSGTSSQWSNSSGATSNRVEMDPLGTQVDENGGFSGGGFSSNPIGFYGDPTNQGTGCAVASAGVTCNQRVRAGWTLFPVYFWSDKSLVRQVFVVPNYMEVPVSYGQSPSDPKGTFDAAYAECKKKLGKSVAPGLAQAGRILSVATTEKVDPTLLAITWRFEGSITTVNGEQVFNFAPTNGLHTSDTDIGDIGPGALFPGIWNKAPYTDDLKNPFGTNLRVGEAFNGDVTDNLKLAARALNSFWGPVRGAKRAEAAGMFRAGTKDERYRARVQNFKDNVKNYDRFFNCLAKKGYSPKDLAR